MVAGTAADRPCSMIGKPNLNFVVPDDEEAKSAIKMVKKYFHQ